ncbi:hypothetical protein CEUSTIGMA_g13094.t1 [Chlamydomonas eustigma]|uniref:Uncharacterized protein n=1 Tax=Chlamydomonas eustigma TaxID=1157962 RepID=A0A250XSA2_9CHLO|nr:hypothetical protein CEUSTIGMA_g13094.t1 [Chlamydomonas eustigma]|eukprot:GAX85680.1 hypothetical protein CEUSTIGMA_g13094.t1 [Chlamydomonas eustigma]
MRYSTLFDDSDVLGVVTHTTVTVLASGPDEQVDGALVAITGVDKAEFSELLERAARHPGYTASQEDLVEATWRDLRLVYPTRGAARLHRASLLSANLLPGAHLLVRKYRMDPLPFCEFPCDRDDEVHTRRIRRLELRVHRRATLVFDVDPDDACRRVRIEIRRGECDEDDLRRTVENTVQVVLLGMPRRVGTGREHPGRVGGRSQTVSISGGTSVSTAISSIGISTSANNSVVVGFGCGTLNTDTANTLIGFQAAQFSLAGGSCTVLGAGAAPSMSGNGNVYVGASSAVNAHSAGNNVVVGYNCGFSVYTGSCNVAIGAGADVILDASSGTAVGGGAVVGYGSVAMGAGTAATGRGEFDLRGRVRGYVASSNYSGVITYAVQVDADALKLCNGGVLAFCAGGACNALPNWGVAATACNDLAFTSCNGSVVRLLDDFSPGLLDFTGQHRCASSVGELLLPGRIVVATGRYLSRVGGKTVPDADEAVPTVEICRVARDPRAFGVVSAVPDVDSAADVCVRHRLHGGQGHMRLRLLGRRRDWLRQEEGLHDRLRLQVLKARLKGVHARGQLLQRLHEQAGEVAVRHALPPERRALVHGLRDHRLDLVREQACVQARRVGGRPERVTVHQRHAFRRAVQPLHVRFSALVGQGRDGACREDVAGDDQGRSVVAADGHAAEDCVAGRQRGEAVLGHHDRRVDVEQVAAVLDPELRSSSPSGAVVQVGVRKVEEGRLRVRGPVRRQAEVAADRQVLGTHAGRPVPVEGDQRLPFHVAERDADKREGCGLAGRGPERLDRAHGPVGRDLEAATRPDAEHASDHAGGRRGGRGVSADEPDGVPDVEVARGEREVGEGAPPLERQGVPGHVGARQLHVLHEGRHDRARARRSERGARQGDRPVETADVGHRGHEDARVEWVRDGQRLRGGDVVRGSGQERGDGRRARQVAVGRQLRVEKGMIQQQFNALTSLRCDPAAYRTDLQQSVGPGNYVIAPYFGVNCSACLQGDARTAPSVGTTGCSECASIIDAESDLLNLQRRATLAPSGKYRGDGSGPTNCPTSARTFALCEGVKTVDTRLVNPPCTLRCTGWNRFEWLCTDPQQHAIVPFVSYVDTSILVKDNHRPMIQRPLDPSMALPPGKYDAASVGAPQWIPKDCGGVGPVGDVPHMLFRSCAEVDRIQNGCKASA